MSNIKSMLNAAWNLIKSAADVNHIHIEYDCYFEESIKECEQIYGSAEVDPLEYHFYSPYQCNLTNFGHFEADARIISHCSVAIKQGCDSSQNVMQPVKLGIKQLL